MLCLGHRPGVEVSEVGSGKNGARLYGLHPGTWQNEVHRWCFLRSDHSGAGRVEGETRVLFECVGLRGSWASREEASQVFPTPQGSSGM